MSRSAVNVIGIGDDGCLGLSSRAFNCIQRSQILVGGERQLAFFPEFSGETLPLKKNLKETLLKLVPESGEKTITILASGDPLFYGIGSLISKYFGHEHVSFIPHLSSIQLAFAAIGMSWQDAKLDSVHGRPLRGLVNRLQTHHKIALLTDSDNSPQRIAHELLHYSDQDWRATVCEDLASPEQRIRHFTLQELADTCDISPLNVFILQRPQAWQPAAVIPFHQDTEFAKRTPLNGLITKQEIRLLSLAKLQLRPTSVMWDIGAGSGSIAIESAKIARDGRVYAIECDPEGVAICEENCRVHRTDNVRVIQGMAPDALMDLEAPDAVFIGGSKGQMESIIQTVLAALQPGGRLVINAVTVDNVSETLRVCQNLGISPELSLVQISRGKSLAKRYLKYEALNPIHIFSLEKPCS
ncbi:MAG: precorrin-6y C5,15-methyltransferase (decarboxylating) subunit CbiE [Oligoflexus sp.]